MHSSSRVLHAVPLRRLWRLYMVTLSVSTPSFSKVAAHISMLPPANVCVQMVQIVWCIPLYIGMGLHATLLMGLHGLHIFSKGAACMHSEQTTGDAYSLSKWIAYSPSMSTMHGLSMGIVNSPSKGAAWNGWSWLDLWVNPRLLPKLFHKTYPGKRSRCSWGRIRAVHWYAG